MKYTIYHRNEVYAECFSLVFMNENILYILHFGGIIIKKKLT